MGNYTVIKVGTSKESAAAVILCARKGQRRVAAASSRILGPG